MSQMYQFPHYGTQRSGTMQYERGGFSWGGYAGMGQNDDTASTAPATITALEAKYAAYFDSAPDTDKKDLAAITAHVYADMIGARMLDAVDLKDYTWWLAEVVLNLYAKITGVEPGQSLFDENVYVYAYSYTQEAKKYNAAAAAALASGDSPRSLALDQQAAGLLAMAESYKSGAIDPPALGPERPFVPLPPLTPSEVRKQQFPGAPVAVAPFVAVGGVLVGGFFLGKLFKWW